MKNLSKAACGTLYIKGLFRILQLNRDTETRLRSSVIYFDSVFYSDWNNNDNQPKVGLVDYQIRERETESLNQYTFGYKLAALLKYLKQG